MTVTYTADVQNSSLSAFVRAIFRWRGSLWKSVYRELIIWCFCYAIISICYRFLMNQEQQYLFEDICVLFFKYSEYIPLTFMLGFFVSQVVDRWQKLFDNLGWCDTYSLYLASYIPGKEERSRLMRRTIVRQLQLLQVMVCRDISVSVRRRFPTMQSVQEAGHITETELSIMESVNTPSKYWLPILWAMGTIQTANKEGRVKGAHFAIQELYKRVIQYRQNNFNLVLFDWVPIPLLYTQVVFITVRFYFIVALLGRQYIISDRHDELRGPLDAYVPVFTIAQFIFYNGWLRVAEAHLNPFGEDDDDFEINFIVDRNTTASYDIVDGDHTVLPQLVKDKFWGEETPEALYSAETVHTKMNPQVGSAVDQNVPTNPIIMVPRMSTTEETIGQRVRQLSQCLPTILGGSTSPPK